MSHSFFIYICPCFFFSSLRSVPSNGNLRTCGWDKETLVATANEWSAHIGLREVPTIEAKTIGKVRRRGSSESSARVAALMRQRQRSKRLIGGLGSSSQSGTSSAAGCPLAFGIRFSSRCLS